MATSPVHGSHGESLTHCFNEIAFNLVCRQFPSDDTVLVNGDIIERAVFAVMAPLISALRAVSLPSGVRENVGGLPDDVMLTANSRFRNTSFMNS